MYLLVFSRPGVKESAIVLIKEHTKDTFAQAYRVADEGLVGDGALELKLIAFLHPDQEQLSEWPTQRAFIG